MLSLCVFAQQDTLVYRCVNTNEKKISLSFDDGPHPVHTEKILSVLEKYDIKATFFIVGQNAEYYPDIVRRIAEEGHEIGNHTFSHKWDKKGTEESFYNELKKTHEKILDICEYDIKLFRPPGGYLNKNIIKQADSFGYKIILWNIDTKDWTHLSPEKIVENIQSNVKKGSIILLHDFIGNHSPTPEALDKIIPLLKEEGYTFVKVGELIDNK